MQSTQPIQAVIQGLAAQAAPAVPAVNVGKGDDFFQTLSAQLDAGMAVAARLTTDAALSAGADPASHPSKSPGTEPAAAGSTVSDASQMAVLFGVPMFFPNPIPIPQTTAGDAAVAGRVAGPGGEGATAALPAATVAKTVSTTTKIGHEDMLAAANLAASGQSMPISKTQTDPVGNAMTVASTQPDGLPAAFDGKFPGSRTMDDVTAKDAQSVAAGGPNVAGRELMFQRALEQMPRATGPDLHTVVDAPLRSAAFVAEIGDRLVWMTSQQSQVAQVSINPPQLGSIEVRLSMNGNEAGAQFYSPNPDVRAALDQAMPRLREVMAESGIMLGQALVSDHSFARQEPAPRSQPVVDNHRDAGAILIQPIQATMRTRVGLGLVDLYA